MARGSQQQQQQQHLKKKRDVENIGDDNITGKQDGDVLEDGEDGGHEEISPSSSSSANDSNQDSGNDDISSSSSGAGDSNADHFDYPITTFPKARSYVRKKLSGWTSKENPLSLSSLLPNYRYRRPITDSDSILPSHNNNNNQQQQQQQYLLSQSQSQSLYGTPNISSYSPSQDIYINNLSSGTNTDSSSFSPYQHQHQHHNHIYSPPLSPFSPQNQSTPLSAVAGLPSSHIPFDISGSSIPTTSAGAAASSSDVLLPNHALIDQQPSMMGGQFSPISASTEMKRDKAKKSKYKVMGLVTVVLVITQLLGIYMFSRGFFPRKVSLQGYSTFDNYFPSCLDNQIVEPQFDKMVFMVVDAFRSGFIFENDLDHRHTQQDNIFKKDPQQQQHHDSHPMTYTRSLIREGKTQSFIARATAPTVTLPRIKALVSGGIPSFVDFVQNFNSKDLREDNLLYQMVQANKTLTFFGDDTWIKLFPDYFTRSDGTTSFYVADTIEVDNNVTRHLNEELARDDWDSMFLHYLGLDHIGHLEGPYSDLMAPKQKEMDDIIKLINEKIIEKDKQALRQYYIDRKTNPDLKKPLPTLFILCSDHGMNEIGNHGGSSDGETSTTLILMGSLYFNQNNPVKDHDLLHLENKEEIEEEELNHHAASSPQDILPRYIPKAPREISQVDIVPTISLLFNLPVPKNSLGRLIPELFEKFIRDDQYLRALEINCLQQIDILKNNTLFWVNDAPAMPRIATLLRTFEQAQEYHRSWGMSPDPSGSAHFHEKATHLYTQFLDHIQDEFTALFTTYDENMLMVGILLIGSSSLVTLLITTATIGMSEHQMNVEIKGAPFAMSFILFVGSLLAIHFGVICTTSWNPQNWFGDNPMTGANSTPNPFCTEEFRMGVLSFVFTALSLLIGFNVCFSKNNISLLRLPSLNPLQLRKEKYVIICGTILHLISLFGSSLVEEEHLTWYYLTTSVILLQLAPHSLSALYIYTSSNPKLYKDHQKQTVILIGILIGLRICRVWNQTGIQWMDNKELLEEYSYIDIGRFLNSEGLISTSMLWILSLLSVIAPCIYVMRLLDKLKDKRGGIISQLSFIYKIIIVFCAIGIFSYKWNYIPHHLVEPVFVARFVYACIGMMVLLTITFPFFSKNERVVSNSPLPHTPSWVFSTLKFLPTLMLVNLVMMFLLLHKTHNMFLFTIMGAIGHYYLKYLLEDTGRRAKSGIVGVIVGMMALNWLGQFGYFALGNSNSLSTIDISGAYTGLIEYNQYLVGILTFLIGYSAPLFFFFVSISYFSHLAIKSVNNNHQSEPSLPNSIGTTNDIIDELQWYSLIGGLLDCGIKWTNVFIFSVCIVIQRYHLFIWTVFSPKFIYEVLDVGLVVTKAFLLFLFIIYLRFLSYCREKYSLNDTSSSQQQNKEE
ncbi:transmembrane protein [Cavenderia fasciculata]|uniref:Transmembrane protein n=1 Tax=Cavenderia fasciculata TaxID=261658 RepID=F4QDE3_CACFS|nr:uncharacterized protein DFA_11532 [Cavenderia fasciculata]EGG13771.1 transmembrane protein [Cavenderia fasciculata]|eukprot:XP_004350479.1 transmembrane protein [Cavenderia fasciculata]